MLQQQPNRIILLDYNIHKPGSKRIAELLRLHLEGRYPPTEFLKGNNLFTFGNAADIYHQSLGGKHQEFDNAKFAAAQQEFVRAQPGENEAFIINIDARASGTRHTTFRALAEPLEHAGTVYFSILSRMGKMPGKSNELSPMDGLEKTDPLLLTSFPAVSVRIFYPKASTKKMHRQNIIRFKKISLGIADAVLKIFNIPLPNEAAYSQNGHETINNVQSSSISNR